MTSLRTSRRSFGLLATSVAVSGLLSSCGGGSARQVSPPTPLSLADDPLFRITDLGSREQFIPRALNNRGDILGSVPSPSQDVLLRSADGTVRTLPLPAGITGSVVEAVPVALNDNGAALVNYTTRDADGRVRLGAFLWQNGAAQDVGTLGGRDTSGRDLNDRNQIVGLFQFPNPANPADNTRGFLWQEGRMSELTVPSRVRFEPRFEPEKINDNGVILGTSYRMKTDSLAYDLDFTGAALLANGSFTLLRGTNGAGDYFSATDLNNRNQVVGNGYTASTGVNSGYLLENSVATRLPAPGGEAEFTTPRAINGFGSIVGVTHRAGGGGGTNIGGGPPPEPSRAFLFRGGRTFDLQTTISADSGWMLQDTYDINDLGQIIGYGTVNGECRTFLLTPTAQR